MTEKPESVDQMTSTGPWIGNIGQWLSENADVLVGLGTLVTGVAALVAIWSSIHSANRARRSNLRLERYQRVCMLVARISRHITYLRADQPSHLQLADLATLDSEVVELRLLLNSEGVHPELTRAAEDFVSKRNSKQMSENREKLNELLSLAEAVLADEWKSLKEGK